MLPVPSPVCRAVVAIGHSSRQGRTVDARTVDTGGFNRIDDEAQIQHDCNLVSHNRVERTNLPSLSSAADAVDIRCACCCLALMVLVSPCHHVEAHLQQSHESALCQ